MNDKSWLSRLLAKKLILGTSIGTSLIFMAIGVIFWGGFNWSLELTNTEEFCISCHEMEDNVYMEYKETIHYSNRSGVRATCPDCHVPKDWIHKIQRKIQASNELLHKMLGTIDTPEKFDAKRLVLAKHEWERMKESDSRECRNCHSFEYMYQKAQKPRAMKQHTEALQAGNTCIDCHKGIAHTNVRDQLSEEELEKLEAPDPELAKKNATLHLFAKDLLEATQKSAEPEAVKPVAAPASSPAASSAPAAASGAVSSINWANIPGKEMTLFYPGQASIEWIHGRDHGGKRSFTKGDRCLECHEMEAADMGQKIVTGEKLEPTPIAGKRGSIPMVVKAAHDSEHLYLQFSWADTAHVPVAFAEGGKMDPQNQIKLAMMVGTDDPEFTDRAGCWGSCHEDANKMPGQPTAEALSAYPEASRLDTAKGLTKYLGESRTEVNMKGDPLGGWDKLKTPAEIAAELSAGKFLDIIRYSVGTGTTEDGYLLDERKMSGGQGAEFSAQQVDGHWIIEMKRKLKSASEGDISLDTGAIYNIGFAIHDDYSDSRFHHVSLGYKLGFDNAEAEINAVKQ